MAKKHWSQMQISSIKASARRSALSNRQVATKSYVKSQITKHGEIGDIYNAIASANIGYDSNFMEPFVATLGSYKKYQYKMVQLRCALKNAQTTSTIARMIVFQFKRDDENAPVLGDFLTGSTSALVYGNFREHDSQNYKILYDTGPVYLAGTTSADGHLQRTYNIKIPLKRLSRRYAVNGNASGADSVVGNIYVACLSDKANASSPATFIGHTYVKVHKIDDQ